MRCELPVALTCAFKENAMVDAIILALVACTLVLIIRGMVRGSIRTCDKDCGGNCASCGHACSEPRIKLTAQQRDQLAKLKKIGEAQR